MRRGVHEDAQVDGGVEVLLAEAGGALLGGAEQRRLLTRTLLSRTLLTRSLALGRVHSRLAVLPLGHGGGGGGGGGGGSEDGGAVPARDRPCPRCRGRAPARVRASPTVPTAADAHHVRCREDVAAAPLRRVTGIHSHQVTHRSGHRSASLLGWVRRWGRLRGRGRGLGVGSRVEARVRGSAWLQGCGQVWARVWGWGQQGARRTLGSRRMAVSAIVMAPMYL